MRFRTVLVAGLIAHAMPAQVPQSALGLTRDVAAQVRAIPPDTLAAFCITNDTLLTEPNVAYLVRAMLPAASATRVQCRGLAVLLVRPACFLHASELAGVVNVNPFTVLLCGTTRDEHGLPAESWIWRAITAPPVKRADGTPIR